MEKLYEKLQLEFFSSTVSELSAQKNTSRCGTAFSNNKKIPGANSRLNLESLLDIINCNLDAIGKVSIRPNAAHVIFNSKNHESLGFKAT